MDTVFWTKRSSPLGDLLLTSDGEALTGLWWDKQMTLSGGVREDDLPLFKETAAWLEIFFNGQKPLFSPPLNPAGTPFRHAVWTLLAEIPYGQTVSYGALADAFFRKTGQKTSARAIGGAVGDNPIILILPCHRVIGADGSLTGYAGGIVRKAALLALEQGRKSKE